MLLKNYISNPIWGVATLLRKVIERWRGICSQIKYHSGKNVRIRKNVCLESIDIVFGENVQLYSNVHIFGAGKVIIGDNVLVGDNTIICAADKIEIGKNTIIAGNCYIIDCNHGTHQGELIRNQPMRCSPVIIGENCWIAANCNILKGSQIGNGCVIGAGSCISNTIHDESFVVPKRDNEISRRQ